VGDFLYRRVAGIEAKSGGYREFQIKPVMNPSITFATGRVHTGYGEILSDWKIEEGMFTIHVKVPVSTTCTLVLPSGQTKVLGSGDYTLQEAYA
jgi:alpha-L-rhamnosidase